MNALEEIDMNHKAFAVIDIQNDITRHYKDIIDRLNAAVEWAAESGMEIVYIQHNNLSAGTRTFKPCTKGAELVPELKIVSDHIFVKTKANALTSYDLKKMPEMLAYYTDKGCEVKNLAIYIGE